MSDRAEVVPMEDQAPPSSVEAEEAVLGSILINPDALLDVASFLQGTDFYIARHMWIWDAITAIYERGEAIDNITVMEELRRRGQLADTGGPAYITQLINNTPTHIHAVTYGRMVERTAIRRRLLNVAAHIAQMALDENADVFTVMDKSLELIDNVAVEKKVTKIVHIKQVVSDVMDEVGKRVDDPQTIPGYRLGMGRIDRTFGGFDRGTAVNWILPTSGGKTLLTVQCLIELAQQTSVLLICTETGLAAMIKRMVNQKLALERNVLRTGFIKESDYSRVVGEFGWLSRLPIRMLDVRRPTILEIKNEIRRLKRRTGENFGAVIVDSASNVKTGVNGAKIFDETRAVSTSLSEIYSTYDLFGMNNWQQNRTSYGSTGVTGGRGGGDIENEADYLFTFDMPDYQYKTGMKKPPEDWVPSDKEKVIWHCVKDRHLGYAGLSFPMWRVLGRGFFDMEDES